MTTSSRGTPLTPPLPTEGAVISRMFRGALPDTSQDAAEMAALMAELGYRETNRVYTPGSYGCGAFLVALALCLVLIGIVVFIYMLLVKPPGTLVVTYERQAAGTLPIVPGGTGPIPIPPDSPLRDAGHPHAD